MKKLLFVFLAMIPLMGFGQKVYTDSLDVAEISGSDTVVFFSLGRLQAGNTLSVEIDYTAIDTNDAYIAVGFSNTGNTFNYATSLYGASADSVQLDTDDAKIVNGVHSAATAVATAQSTIMFVGNGRDATGKFFGIKLIKGSATTGVLYFYTMKL